MRSLALILVVVIFLPYSSFAQQSECDYKIEVIVDGEEFEKEDFKWRMRATKIEGKSTNITGTAEIEDSNGKTIKNYKPWTSDSISKQKTSNEYTPNLKPGSYEITAEISVECDDTNKDNNVDSKKIKIKGEIEEIKDKKSKNEETEITSKKTENQDNNQIIPNSQNPIATKPKKSAASEEFDNTVELKSQNNQKSQQVQSITANTIQNLQNTETVYESSGERAKQWIMVFLLTLSILLNIILIWKR